MIDIPEFIGRFGSKEETIREVKSSLQRYSNQTTIEENFHNITFTNSRDIVMILRKQLLTNGWNVDKYDIDEHRRERASAGNINFIPSDQIESRLENLYSFIDETYRDLEKRKNSPEYEEMIHRFATVIFVLGIMIHPFADGNGQTFRVFIEYLLLKLKRIESSNHLLPFRSKIYKGSTLSAPLEIVANMGDENIDVRLLQFRKVRDLLKNSPDDMNDQTEWIQEIERVFPDFNSTSDDPYKFLNNKIGDLDDQSFDEDDDGEVIRTQSGKFNYFLFKSLEDKNGTEFLREYILAGPENILETMRFRLTSYDIYEFTKDRLVNLLQSQDTHSENYSDIKNEYEEVLHLLESAA